MEGILYVFTNEESRGPTRDEAQRDPSRGLMELLWTLNEIRSRYFEFALIALYTYNIIRLIEEPFIAFRMREVCQYGRTWTTIRLRIRS